MGMNSKNRTAPQRFREALQESFALSIAFDAYRCVGVSENWEESLMRAKWTRSAVAECTARLAWRALEPFIVSC